MPPRTMTSAPGARIDCNGRRLLGIRYRASTAAANELPLYTRNPSDLGALKRILKVIKI